MSSSIHTPLFNLYFFSEALITGTVMECKFTCPMHSKAKQTEMSEFEAEKDLLQGYPRRQVDHAPSPNSLKGFNKAFLKAWWREGMVNCCKFLGFRNLCLAAVHWGQVRTCSYKPPTRQMLFSVLQIVYEWNMYLWRYTLKHQSLENGLSYILQAMGSILVARAISYKG